MGVGALWHIGRVKTIKKIEELQHHPFELKDFTLVHNGIINNAKQLFKRYKIQTPIKTDSYAILHLIWHYFEKSQEEDRQERILDAIQKTTQKLDGWYSIVLYDKKDNKLYYFKDFITNFNFCIINKSFLIGSTHGLNINYSYIGTNKTNFTPKENTIYLLGDYGRGRFFKEIGKFKCQKNEDRIKKGFMLEKPGEIYELINNLPGNPKDYEISEELKIKIPYLIMNKVKSKLLKNYLTSEKIKFIIKDQSFILKLEDLV